ncbi:spore germination protein [Gracilibacillus suaedae]|uniref:spore germination protein n=1 Tax=Gracilibacillus suaedae TaxID=2820273 RepID=UPI001ABDF6C8|nr:spore germination protein [Gracilibacillus suaedae]
MFRRRIQQPVEIENNVKNEKLSTNINVNVSYTQSIMGRSDDLIIQRFSAATNNKLQLAISYIDGIVNSEVINSEVMERVLLGLKGSTLSQKVLNGPLEDFLVYCDLSVSQYRIVHQKQEMIDHLLIGNAILFIDGFSSAVAISVKAWEDRNVSKPDSQTVVRGPKDGFIETLRTNTSLIRRRIKSPKLRFITKTIGELTKTNVCIGYIDGIANDKIITELEARLDRINIDAVLESGNIEELIQDETASIFPTILNTERPDAACAGLLEGRVVVIIDGSPFVLILPSLFIQYIHASEDYYHRTHIAIAIRMLRVIALFLAIFTPSIYVALSTFHQEMIPSPLLVNLASQREGVPFPSILEAVVMLLAFEILHEAGIRMPRAVGSAISIVGALVLGEVAVQAGFVSSVMVIVVALTGICTFVIPAFSMAMPIRLIRFLFLIFSSLFGLIGVLFGTFLLIFHLCSLRSFGVPYMTPFGPFILQEQEDAILRLPLWRLIYRPLNIVQKDKIRQQNPRQAKPKPPKR